MIYLDLLKNIISEFPEISDYQIKEEKESRFELYYVLDKLETYRLVKTNSCSVVIYKKFTIDDVNYLGQTSLNLDDNLTIEEIKEKLKEAIKRCTLVKNKEFDLPSKDSSFKYDNNSKFEIKDVAFKISDAIFKANQFKEGWINSTEIFTTTNDIHFINSKGCDYSYSSNKIFIEVIPTWSGKAEEVELYFSKEISDEDYLGITKSVTDILYQAKSRSEATHLTQDLDCPVIIRDEEVKSLLTYFPTCMNYSTQLKKVSRYSLNFQLQDNKDYDMLDVTLRKNIVGSSLSRPIDDFGTVIKDTKIIEDGKFVNMYGDCKFGKYLGIDNPTGNIFNFDIRVGNTSFKEMTKTPYLICENFSAFQVDSSSGYYGGEVRLGHYFDGKKLTPITGFTVSGNLFNDIKELVFSSEDVTLSGYHGPKYVKTKMSIIK